ncbi:DUF1353 domain-containing protein, partial [Vibrio parahaemolyticus]
SALVFTAQWLSLGGMRCSPLNAALCFFSKPQGGGNGDTRYIEYRSDYKYQLADDYEISIAILPKSEIRTEFIDLDTSGNLLVKSGYAWDGPSGPVIDTEENMRASLIHDALYQLMRYELLSTRTHRKAADQLFKDICVEDGVSNFRATAYYKALCKFGRPAASPQNKKVVVRAPKT